LLAILDNSSINSLNTRTKPCFISYIHEERYRLCIERVLKRQPPGAGALFYIISGCDELWKAGVETFFDFEKGAAISAGEDGNTLSENGSNLLRLGYYLVSGFSRDSLIQNLGNYIAGLEYVHLELAIEALKLALYPGMYES